MREGFETTFALRVSQPDPGASACRVGEDAHTQCRSRGGGGAAFVVQNWHPAALGAGGTDGLGYAGLRNSLAVEFDTYFDAGGDGDRQPLHEPGDNHVSVHTRGVAAGNSPNHTYSLGHAAGPRVPDLGVGTHIVRIVYRPQPPLGTGEESATAVAAAAAAAIGSRSEVFPAANDGAGSAFLSDLLTPPLAGPSGTASPWAARGFGMLSVFIDDAAAPVLVVPLNLDATLDVAASNGRAWIGFRASTGSRVWQAHDVLSWRFTELREDYA